MIQVEQGSWSIPIAPQGAVEHTFASRKLDLNVAYLVDLRAITFPPKRGQEQLGANAERVAHCAVTVLEPGWEGIEREINMGLPKPIPQGADERTLRSILYTHELWFNLLLSIGYPDQQARQIIQSGGVTAQVLANAPGRGQAYMFVEEDEYETIVKDPTTQQPVVDVTTGQPRKEKRIGENRHFCSPAVYQKNRVAARTQGQGQGQGGQPSGLPMGQPSFTPPPGFASAPVAQIPTGGFAGPAPAGSNPFTGVPGGAPLAPNGQAGFPGVMNTLTTPRA